MNYLNRIEHQGSLENKEIENIMDTRLEISKEQIRTIRDNIDDIDEDLWHNIAVELILPEPIIIEFIDKLNLRLVAKYQKVSESFLREFINDWGCVSQYQELSESFLREFKDEVCWDILLIYNRCVSDLTKITLYDIWKDKITYKFMGCEDIKQIERLKTLALRKDKIAHILQGNSVAVLKKEI